MSVKTNKKQVCVVVLGDWGRSPRMQYHALSLAKNGFTVDVVAYKGSEPHTDVRNNQHITLNALKEVPRCETYLPKLLTYVFKTLWQSVYLFFTLLTLTKPNILLLQNPPSIPALPVCWIFCFLRRCKLVIDYHNYGYTILGLSAGHNHFFVKICKWCEGFFGKRAAMNICVTKSMKEDLNKSWNVRSVVFYDCSPEIFHPIDDSEKHELFMKLSKHYKQFRKRSKLDSEVKHAESSRFTVKVETKSELLQKRPALIVSSTSWTEDEDFSILLNALEEYEEFAEIDSTLPNLVVAITGKGPLKSFYEGVIEQKFFNHVEIVTLWLQAEDYPTFLGCADLGVCLHNSSSGLDLPMKVVDMFGCQLPVCAVSYKCINELVKDGVNGLIFSSSRELSSQLQNLLKGFPNNAELQKYRKNLEDSPPLRWDSSWNITILPLFQQLCS